MVPAFVDAARDARMLVPAHPNVAALVVAPSARMESVFLATARAGIVAPASSVAPRRVTRTGACKFESKSIHSEVHCASHPFQGVYILIK